MRLTFAGYAAASVALTAGVIANAYVHEPQFYLACVYLVKSNGSLMVRRRAALVSARDPASPVPATLADPGHPVSAASSSAARVRSCTTRCSC